MNFLILVPSLSDLWFQGSLPSNSHLEPQLPVQTRGVLFETGVGGGLVTILHSPLSSSEGSKDKDQPASALPVTAVVIHDPGAGHQPSSKQEVFSQQSRDCRLGLSDPPS